MDTLDFLLLPVYLGIVYLIAMRIKSSNAKDPIYQQYFMRGFNYKMIGTIGFAFIYLFYYRGGDTTSFYRAIAPVCTLFYTNPKAYFSFVFSYNQQYPNECLYIATKAGVFYIVHGAPSLTTIKIGSILGLVACNSFLPLTLVFSMVSYMMVWRAFRLFVSIYPYMEKDFAIAFLMIPSVVFWGSGIGKDSLMLSAIMAMVVSFYQIFILRKNILINIFILIITAYIASAVRAFILFALGPSLILMAVVHYRNAFASPVVRFLALPIFLVAGVGGSYFFVESIGKTVQSYNIDSLEKKAEGFQSWHTRLGEVNGGSLYSLGDEVDYTAAGIAKKAPLAILVTLFGPFVWQIRNAVMLLSGMESITFLYYFVTIFFTSKIYKAFGILFRDHIIVLCLPFIVIVAIAIGLTSFNYGALVRYKIPILPFFVVLLALARYRLNETKL